MKLKINRPAMPGKNFFENARDAFGGGRSAPPRVSHLHAAYVCALAGAFIAALLVCLMVQTFLAGRTMQLQTLMAQLVAKRPPSIFSAGTSTPNAKIKFNAFNVSIKTPVEETKEEKKEAKPIDSFRLIGTVAPVAAWITVDSVTSLVLKDQEFNGYRLEVVSPGSVTFELDDEEYDLYLNFSANQPVAAKPPQAAAQQQAPQAAAKNANVDMAELNGKEGVITREFLNNLLMNPYNELGKVRIIPSQAGGITIRNMRQDSLLHQLGVKQNDQITGINGVPIKDMPSIMNAMNSMMSGSRLDFDVIRDKQPGKLSYVVK